MSEQSEQMSDLWSAEFRTNDKSHSRSLYLKFLGATVGNKETGIPCNGDYNEAMMKRDAEAGILKA